MAEASGPRMSLVQILPEDEDELEMLQMKKMGQCMGQIGLWQAVWCTVLSSMQFACIFEIFMFVFHTAHKDFWCARPAAFANMNVSVWRQRMQPNDPCLVKDLEEVNGISDMDFEKVGRHYKPCTEFEWSSEDGEGKTLVEEFGLVCEKEQYLSVIEMSFLGGAAAGSITSGYISDHFGRRHTLMSFLLVQNFFGAVVAFSQNIIMYMILRVITGFASMTVAIVSFVLVVELVSGKWRTICGILNIVPVAITYIVTAGIAYFVKDWRSLQLIISVPFLAYLILWFWMPESPRWLMAQGRLEELYNIVERAAKMNRRELPANYKKSLEAVTPKPNSKRPQGAMESGEGNTAAANTSQTQNPLVMVFSKEYCQTTCLTFISWLSLIIIYFGLTLHLSNLGGNIYVNITIAGIIETVIVLLSILFVLKFGLRRNLIVFMLVPGLCLLATNLVPHSDYHETFVMTLAVIAKCVIGASNAIVPTFTAQQYPTAIRNLGIGLGNLAAGVGLMLVPYMWLLEDIDIQVPLNIMGASGILGALAFYLMDDVND